MWLLWRIRVHWEVGDEERGVTSAIMLGIRFCLIVDALYSPLLWRPDVPRVWSSILLFHTETTRRRRDVPTSHLPSYERLLTTQVRPLKLQWKIEKLKQCVTLSGAYEDYGTHSRSVIKIPSNSIFGRYAQRQVCFTAIKTWIHRNQLAGYPCDCFKHTFLCDCHCPLLTLVTEPVRFFLISRNRRVDLASAR